MASIGKPEFPPLLPPGLHVRSLPELRRLCVVGFPHSTTRPPIMDGLESVARQLCSWGFAGQLWVDGSFLTKKLDPGDADLVLGVPAAFYDKGSPGQQGVIDWFAQNDDVKTVRHCDAYVWVEYPTADELYQETVKRRTYWSKQYGFSRGGQAKGIAVVWLPAGLTLPSGNP